MSAKKTKEYHENDQLIIFGFDPISYPVDNVPQAACVVLVITQLDGNFGQGGQLLVINVEDLQSFSSFLRGQMFIQCPRLNRKPSLLA
jgi:hypothetical protein